MRLGRHPVFNRDGGDFQCSWSLIFDPTLNLADKLGLPAYEAGVLVVVAVSASLLGEAIHVELADIGLHVLMLEVDGQNIGRKMLNVADDKAVLLIVPADGLVKVSILNSNGLTSSI